MTSKNETFGKTSENLLSRISKQDGNTDSLARTLTKIYCRYFSTFRKFCNTSKEFNSLTK